MPKRHRRVEIYSPTLGIKSDVPTNIMDVRAMPTAQNAKMYYGVNQKEFGTSIYTTNTGAGSTVAGVPTSLFEAQFPGSTLLQVHTPSNVYKYTSGLDSYVSDGQTFTGTFTDFWSGVMHNDAYVYTNGVNPLQVKLSFSATGTNMASAVSPTTYTAYTVLSMRDHLLLYHPTINGAEHYKGVVWSKKGALTYAAGTTDFASGVAAALDIQDGDGNLMTAVPFQGGAAVLFERCLHYQYWVGGDEVWRFQKTVPGIGTPARRGAVSYRDVCYFLGRSNVYAYKGGSIPEEIGNPIKKAMFAELNQQYIGNSFVDFDPTENELIVAIPTGTSISPDTQWVYRVSDDSWSRKIRNHSAAGRFSRASGLTIGDLVGDIGAQNWTFGEAIVRVDAQIRIYGDPSGRVVKNDITRYSISETGTSVAQTYSTETPDITGTQQADPVDGDKSDFVMTNQRWQRLSIEMYGQGTAIVSYSTDRGSTFTAVSQSPVTLVNNGTTHLLDMDVSNPFIRIGIDNTGLNEFIGVRYVALDFIPGASY